MADLEERGVAIAQTRAKQDLVTRPRAVLRRNTVLPFNAKSGWGTLTSVETINTPEPTSIPPIMRLQNQRVLGASRSAFLGRFRHDAVPQRQYICERSGVRFFPPSSKVPSHRLLFRYSVGQLFEETCRPQKRLEAGHHLISPYFASGLPQQREHGRSDREAVPQPESVRRSLTAKHFSKPETRVRPNRPKSEVEVPKDEALSRFDASLRHTRSISMCSQSSGHVPEASVPPLPLDVARLKTEEQRKSLLSRSPSNISVDSFESVGISILATRSSPIMSRTRNPRLYAVSKRDWRNSMITGPRPLQDTISLHSKNQRSQG